MLAIMAFRPLGQLLASCYLLLREQSPLYPTGKPRVVGQGRNFLQSDLSESLL